MKFYLNAENTIAIDLFPILLALPSLIIIPIIIYIIIISFNGMRAKVPGSKLIFWGLIGYIFIGVLVERLLGLSFIEEHTHIQLIALLINFTSMLALVIPAIGLKRTIYSHFKKSSD